ncbi:unnamed protein product [Caenorhabditis bovis]|uniref:Uncharacterized protein n=1 Tax=Caenorhabditis bovis TaxID=2654633 RepID=A0A8S1E5W2_9PELO|nr:unnamed protein product [Caenorhabditis bovis]
MLLAGIIYSLPNLVVSFPCSFSYCSFIKQDFILIWLSTPNSIGFLSYLLSNFGFCVFRITLFLNVTILQNFVYNTTQYLPWILAFVAVFESSFQGCMKRYNRWDLRYTFDCSNCEVWFGISFTDVNYYVGRILPIVMMVLYATITAISGALFCSILLVRFRGNSSQETLKFFQGS